MYRTSILPVRFDYYFDSSKASKELDWMPEISSDTGFSAAVQLVEDTRGADKNWSRFKMSSRLIIYETDGQRFSPGGL
jgi:hypothetical protein